MKSVKNIVIIVIDALSKWYIDQYKNEESFFAYLEKTGYSASNIYSTGPFTEAGIRGLWAADDALRGKSYLIENEFRKKTIFQIFKDLGCYIYLGELIPFLDERIISDNKIFRETLGPRGFERIWGSRLRFYIELYQKNKLKEADLDKIKYLLDGYFERFPSVPYVNKEYQKYMKNNKEYILDILLNEEKSSFFKNQDHSMYDLYKYRNIENFWKQYTHEMSEEEMEFVCLTKKKNTEFLLKMNEKFNCKDTIEYELNGSRSRCVHSNENILFHMRDDIEKLPKLKEELNEFLKWYDIEGESIERPFFAYIHNFDFHYPENFMNIRYEDNQIKYKEEVKKKLQQVECLQCGKMSVSKQLSLLNIEECLKNFYEQIRQRKMDKNTLFVITSDHGISNFMYPINKKDERWNYTKFNFQIPLYIYGCGIKKYKDNRVHSSKVILPTLVRACQCTGNSRTELLDDNKEFITTSWINGVPDYDYQKIKFGVRTKEYSITYESFLNQFYSSDNIVGLYDLLDDPDECNNLCNKEVKNIFFNKIMDKLSDLWFDEIINIIESDEEKNGLQDKYDFLLQKKEYFRMINKKAEYLADEQFEDILKKKKIVLVGDKENVLKFLLAHNCSYKIQELWMDDIEEPYFMGHSVVTNWRKKITEEEVIIVGNNEMELLNDLLEKKCCTCCLIQKRRYDKLGRM